jgi:manganese transport system permease protein
VVAVGSGVVGTYASYYANVSTGGSVVVSLTVAFVLAYVFGPRHGVIARARLARRPPDTEQAPVTVTGERAG